MIEPDAAVTIVGLKDGIFVQDILSPNIEPWFAINTIYTHSCFTKDAKSYCESIRYSISDLDKVLPLRWDEVICGSMWEFDPEERVSAKQAISRYVTEMAGQNK